MTQYNSLNAKLSNSQLNKLKSAKKKKKKKKKKKEKQTEIVLKVTSTIVGNSDNEINFAHKLLLTKKQVANLRKSTHQLILSY